MRLERLWLGAYKNLRDVAVEFESSDTTILLGQNGTGKSNLIEALVEAFAELHLGRIPSFDVELRYVCNGRRVEIACHPSRGARPVLSVDGRRATQRAFWARRQELLPRHVFAYYSGPSNRLVEHFEDHQRRFYDALIRQDDARQELPLRPLFYAQPVHSQFVLLANDEAVNPAVAEIVRERLGIEAIESVLFVLKRPEWAKAGRAAQLAKGGDRYWGASGEVRRLIDSLHEIAFAPGQAIAHVRPQFNKPRRRQERRLLYLPTQDHLRRLFKRYDDSPRNFFKALESMYISDMLEEVRIRVRRKDGSVMTFTELSEGEQQLLTVLGLIAFTGEDESLFLLDEPDTHINPQWAGDYVRRVRKVLVRSRGTHVLMATHDPLIVGEVERQQIVLFEQDEQRERVSIATPAESPRGLGVAGVLTGEFFGLKTTLDESTQKLLDERYELELRLRSPAGLDPAGSARLQEVSEQLAELGFATTVRDPLLSEYLQARAELIADPDPVQRRKLAKALARSALADAVERLQ